MAFKVTKLPEPSMIQSEKLVEAENEIPEGSLEFGMRNIARLTARGIESAAGLPGDIAGGVLGVTNWAINKLTGVPDILPSNVGLPTSQEIRTEITKPLTGQYLEPLGSAEEFGDAVISDTIPLLLPIKNKIPFMRALTTAGLGNLASLAAKNFGFGHAGQIGAKIGTMIATSLVGPSQIKNYMSSLYQKAESAIPEGVQVSAKPIQDAVKKISNIVDKGITTPSKENVIKILQGIDQNISHSGFIPVNQVIEIKKNLNEILGGIKNPRGVEKLIPSLSQSMKDVIQDYGKRNKAFISNFNEAENIYKGLYQTSKLTNFLKEHVKADRFITPLTAILLGMGGAPTAKVVGGLFTARGILPALESVAKSGAIRRYYLRSIAQAAKKNVPGMLKDVNALDKALAKNFPNMQQQSGKYKVTKI